MKTGAWLTLGMTLVALAAWAAAPAPVKVRVLKDKVNLRATNVPTAEVVGQVAANDILVSKSMSKEWVEVVPPANVDLWILGDYVKDGVIRGAPKVNVRSGPGVNFICVGKLAADAKVEVRGTMKEWTRIAPPENCSLWVSRSLVEVVADKPARPEPPKAEPAKVEPPKAEPAKAEPVQAAAAKPAEKAPAKAAAKPAERVSVYDLAHSNETMAAIAKNETAAKAREKPAETNAALRGLDLIPSLGQGQWKQYDGTLRSRGFFFRTPARYRLVSYDQDGNGTTVCYVRGNNDQLSTLIDRPMIVSGREYWVQKQEYPVLVPERIVLK